MKIARFSTGLSGCTWPLGLPVFGFQEQLVISADNDDVRCLLKGFQLQRNTGVAVETTRLIAAGNAINYFQAETRK